MPPSLPKKLPPSVLHAVQAGNKIEAIKLMREQTGLGLKEAKDAVDAYLRQSPPMQGGAPGEVPKSSRAIWWVVAGVAAAAALVALTGCGGGSGSASVQSSDPTQASAIPEVLPTVLTIPEVLATQLTIPAYKALRVRTVAIGSPVPDVATMAALTADNHHLAVAQLKASLAGGAINLAVAPPLTYAVLRSLGLAASGDSLAEISRNFDLAPTPFVASQQTSRVASQLWADRGRQFRAEFLSATDTFGPWPRLAAWSADEAGFAAASAASDSAFTQSLAAASGLSIDWFGAQTNIRLLMAHSLAANAGWGALAPFNGIFERAPNDLVLLPLLRLTDGVSRFAGADFTADLLAGGDLHLMTLRPASGTLTDFAATRLEPALAEAVQALLSGGAAPAAGEMLLPRADIALALQADGPLRRAGVAQVYDEVLANLPGLDGLGGTYVQTASPAAALHIAADGLSLQAADALAFTFSPRNLHGPTNGSSAGAVFTLGNAFPLGTCVWPATDLRSFFLVLLDTRHWVVSFAAIQSLPGAAVAPACRFVPPLVPTISP